MRLAVVAVLTLSTRALAEPSPPAEGLVARWSFEGDPRATAADVSGGRHGAVPCGVTAAAPGVLGKAVLLDGETAYLAAPNTPDFDFSQGLSVSAWVNVHGLGGRGQQMIVAKNVYAADLREWSLLIDEDRRFRLYVYNGGTWRTLASVSVPVPGKWYQVVVSVSADGAAMYVNGAREALGSTGLPEAPTPAPLTIGGVNNGGALMQLLLGALDEVCLYNRPLTAGEVGSMSFEVNETHSVPAEATVERYRLWDGELPPAATEVPLLEGVRFSGIKAREPEVHGFDWLHGVALVFHEGTLHASWGNNSGAENTASEIVRGRRSSDGGLTWSEVETIGVGSEEEGNSHGVFLVHEGGLWALHARFGRGEGRFPGLCMEAFTPAEATGAWRSRGIVGRGIWPLQEPVRMADGNFIVPGCDEHWRAAVAISHGDDLLHWDAVKLPVGTAVHTEAALWAEGPEVLAVMRNESPVDPGLNCAAVSVSHDFGRTWSPSEESNFPMATSKPVAGVLSTGQRYLICNVCRESPNSRRTLAIAVGRPGEKSLCRLWRIETTEGALAYPYAVEHEGHLYVAYSSAPPGVGGNRNDAKLAVLPVAALAVGEGDAATGE